MNSFFEELGDAFAAAAHEQGITLEPPRLDEAVAAELLDFSRLVAHSTERRFAPLSTYLAGLATAGVGADRALEMLQTVRAKLESPIG